MHLFTLTAMLLAEERLEYLTRGFRQRPRHIDFNDVMLSVGVAVLFIVLLWLLSRLIDARQERKPFNSRLELFFRLCRAHNLAWRQAWLLWRVARSHRLREPARVFVEPERLEPDRLSRSLKTRADQVEAIRQRLFAGLPATGHTQAE